MTAADMAHVVDNELDLGDIVAHHGLAVRSSNVNLSSTVWTTYIVQYVVAESLGPDTQGLNLWAERFNAGLSRR